MEDNPQASILIVDDRAANRSALEAVLEPLGHRLVQARSGDEALKHLLSEDFALILMDVSMPGLDGFQTVALIKQRPATASVPIMFMSAIARELHFIEQGFLYGAVDYITKPFDPAILARQGVGAGDAASAGRAPAQAARAALAQPVRAAPPTVRARGGRARERAQGSVPGHDLPRAARAGEPDSGLGQPAARRHARRRQRARGARDHRSQRRDPGAARRRSGRRVAHDARQAASRARADQPRCAGAAGGAGGAARRRPQGGDARGDHPAGRGSRPPSATASASYRCSATC